MYNRVQFVLENINGRILDVGHCVGPLHSEIIKKTGKDNVYGLDTEVKKPTKRNLRGSAEKMPFKSNFFDTLVAGELVEHLYAPEKFFSEAKRVLKKGGTLIVTTPNIESFINRLTRSYHAPAHIYLFTKRKLFSMLRKHGFKIRQYACFPYTEESSSGSKFRFFFILRKILHYFLPQSLQEQMCIVAVKK